MSDDVAVPATVPDAAPEAGLGPAPATAPPDTLDLLDAALGVIAGGQVRTGQRTMASAVERALREGGHLLVQAGTGTGKSLAYLVPAISFGIASGKRVVVATATKALQAQLVDKDLPRLAAALTGPLGRTPSYALAKGRSNYVCLQQVRGGPGAIEEPDGLFEDTSSRLGAQVVRLRQWAEQTDSGDRDAVPFPVGDQAWRQVSVSSRDCLGGRCPDRRDCFAELAREKARDADIVVANHALLAVQVLSGVPVLPEYDAVVLDEAHEFVSSATEALTLEVSRGELRRAARAASPYLGAAGKERVEDAAEALDDLLGMLPVGLANPLPTHALDVLALVAGACAAAATEIGSGRPEGVDELEQATRERARTALSGVAEACAQLRAPGVPSAAYATADGAGVRLRVSPLHVGGALAEELFGDTPVIATSATLTLGGSFEHTATALGLPAQGAEPAWSALDVGSPFDYRRQGQLWVAAELPSPSSPGWAPAVDELILELVTAAGGRTLALFSSTAAAARAATVVRAGTDLPVLLQGEDTPGALQRRFAADARTCLFGTRSFWQGVDTPGSACQLVIIDRIPFAHVDDPLVQARLAAAGPRGFRDVTLPPAAVLLAQGAGRLLRSTTDRGVVAVLDPRLATASYADVLLATLPGFYRARSKPAVLASLRAIDAAAAPVLAVGGRRAQRRTAGLVAAG